MKSMRAEIAARMQEKDELYKQLAAIRADVEAAKQLYEDAMVRVEGVLQSPVKAGYTHVEVAWKVESGEVEFFHGVVIKRVGDRWRIAFDGEPVRIVELRDDKRWTGGVIREGDWVIR